MNSKEAQPQSQQVLSPELQALLVCPVDKADLVLDGSVLICQRCGRQYPVEDGIPNMLVEE